MSEWICLELGEVESTNDEALRLSQKMDVQQKAVVTAIKQTKGRGRRGRDWASLEGNLFMSLVISAELKDLGKIVLLSSLSLHRTIKSLCDKINAKVELKWPNDVLINGQKVSGMLLEKGAGEYLIIGIGVNIVAVPKLEGLIYPAISLKKIGIMTDRESFLQKYLAIFDEMADTWRHEGFEKIRKEWLNSVKGLGDIISVMNSNTIIKGVFDGVDENGSLLLEVDGKITKILAGDVFYMKDEK